ncbi:phosphoribulokinase, chloroplastic [Senna tora]|uniref:Phosphoribulokinase, chloroplastic n=1 Tax=Senna tora TaxID=362788 RepID=A0A834TV80_9FABA|nr:phosphoribulokinase, chloroplastic [Senna tora]
MVKLIPYPSIIDCMDEELLTTFQPYYRGGPPRPRHCLQYDPRVRELLDFSIYLDISNEVKSLGKFRDMAERGHSLESIKASIEARKPDFEAFIDPQKQYADAVIEVLPTQLIPDDNEGKKLTCSYPGIKFFYGPETYYGHEPLNQVYGELTAMLKHAEFPGSNNGTGLFQTIIGLKIRDLFEQILASRAQTQQKQLRLTILPLTHDTAESKDEFSVKKFTED